ncbi:MAG: acetyl-CoA carboxylase biotin carboxyl carrier protein subunit, partial [Betaproteobacteria bacterium]|nr:acetyl-CoA carboxylase biotin carboxyl carrier protein subunit [Betaproteobacteria bacterium]
VIAIHAAVGDEVRAGQVLLVIEAMKMEHSLQAEVDGKLLSLNVELGDQVADAALLAQIERTTRA